MIIRSFIVSKAEKWVLAIGIVIVMAIWGAYQVGLQQTMLDHQHHLEVSQALEQTVVQSQQTEHSQLSLTQQLKAELSELTREKQQLQATIIHLEHHQHQLKTELHFYQHALRTPEVAQGVHLSGMRWQGSVKPNTYRFSLLLGQSVSEIGETRGEVELWIEGKEADGTFSKVSYTELSGRVPLLLRFQLRYFQELVGECTLPEAFEPLRLHLRLKSDISLSPAVEYTYHWQELPMQDIDTPDTPIKG